MLIQSKIQHQDIDDRLIAHDAAGIFHLGVNDLPELCFTHSARLGDTRHLELRGSQRNVRIKPASGSSHHIRRNGIFRIRAIFFYDFLRPFRNSGRSRAQIASGGARTIVIHRRRTAVKIFILCECLRNLAAADILSGSIFHQRTVGGIRHQYLSNRPDHQGIGNTAQQNAQNRGSHRAGNISHDIHNSSLLSVKTSRWRSEPYQSI